MSALLGMRVRRSMHSDFGSRDHRKGVSCEWIVLVCLFVCLCDVYSDYYYDCLFVFCCCCCCFVYRGEKLFRSICVPHPRNSPTQNLNQKRNKNKREETNKQRKICIGGLGFWLVGWLVRLVLEGKEKWWKMLTLEMMTIIIRIIILITVVVVGGYGNNYACVCCVHVYTR